MIVELIRRILCRRNGGRWPSKLPSRKVKSPRIMLLLQAKGNSPFEIKEDNRSIQAEQAAGANGSINEGNEE